jgi:AcrR family transcriptional regulator
MNKQDDLRIFKTKKAIKKAFFDLVSEKTFEKVAISDIADKAMINRATFYLHYQDKYDLLNNLENEVLNDIEKISSIVTRKYILICTNQGLVFPHVKKMLSYVEANPQFFNLVANDSIGLPFYHKIGEKISKKIFEEIPELKSDQTLWKYMQNVIISAYSSIINQWIKNDRKESKEEIALLITKLTKTMLGDIKIS